MSEENGVAEAPSMASSSPNSSCGYGSDSGENFIENSSLRVCSESNQGMRKYMEDELTVLVDSEREERRAFLGIFDGHGGKDAPIFARDNLWNNIKMQPKFESDDPEEVKMAIRDGFIKTHWDMFNAVGKDGNMFPLYFSHCTGLACYFFLLPSHLNRRCIAQSLSLFCIFVYK